MFDVLLLCTLSVATFGLVAPRVIALRLRRCVIIAAVLICIVQIVFEGPRLQLLLGYVVTVLFAVGALFIFARERSRTAVVESTIQPKASLVSRIVRWLAATVTFIALVTTVLLCVAFPRYEFPMPSGHYALGVHEFRLTDPSRLELNTTIADDHRQLLVRVTYPAAAKGDDGLQRSTVPNSVIASILPMHAALQADALGLSSWGRIATHAKINAPVAPASKKYPVLIFSHGMAGTPEQNTTLVEELASHGYIVMAINHPYISRYFKSSGGIVSGPISSDAAVAGLLTPELIKKIQSVNARLNAATSTAELTPIIKERDALLPEVSRLEAEHTKLMSDDQRFVLDNLVALQAGDSLFSGHLDLDRIGVFGMSVGGSASVITCAFDARCQAGLNMDGWTRSPAPLPSLRKPFMHMNSEHFYFGLFSYEQSVATGYYIRVKGTAHYNFTDTVLAAPQAKRFGMLGPIDATRMLELTNQYVLAFFNKHLLDQNEPLLEGPSNRFPEVSFQTK